MTSTKYVAHDRYIDLLIEYFIFDKKEVRASILFLFSSVETERWATWTSPNLDNDVSIATFSNVGANSSQAITNVCFDAPSRHQKLEVYRFAIDRHFSGLSKSS